MVSSDWAIREESVVRIGCLTVAPVVRTNVVTDWIVPLRRDGYGAQVLAAARLSGAWVWLVDDVHALPEWMAFEAAYWGLGLLGRRPSGTCIVLRRPEVLRPAGYRELELAGARGWRMSVEGADSDITGAMRSRDTSMRKR